LKNIEYNSVAAILVDANINYLRISNLKINESARNGILIEAVNHYIVENNELLNVRQAGVVIYGSTAYIDDNPEETGSRNGIVGKNKVHFTTPKDNNEIRKEDAFALHKGDPKNDKAGSDVGNNHVFIENNSHGANENALDITAGKYSLFIRNIGTNFTENGISMGHGSKNVILYENEMIGDDGIKPVYTRNRDTGVIIDKENKKAQCFAIGTITIASEDIIVEKNYFHNWQL